MKQIDSLTFTDSQRKKLLDSIVILVDTREHKGKNDHILDWFDKQNIPWERKKLNAGDYSLYLPKNEKLGITQDISFEDEVMVERKASLIELSGNITAKGGSKPGQRIENEFARSPKNKVLLIENASYEKLVTGNYNTDFAPKAFWAKLFTYWHRYDVPTYFMENTRYSGQFIYGYLYYYLRERIHVAR